MGREWFVTAFSNSRRIIIYPLKKKKDLSHLLAIKQGISLKKLVKKCMYK
jgi:hypothetical protein